MIEKQKTTQNWIYKRTVFYQFGLELVYKRKTQIITVWISSLKSLIEAVLFFRGQEENE